MPTVTQPLALRILEGVTGAPLRPGQTVTVAVDRIMAHDGTGPAMAQALEKAGISTLRGVEKLVLVFDHYYPPTSEREASLHQAARTFARCHDIPLYEGEGIAHQLLPEKGLVSPGRVLVGADSHTCTMGAFGAFAIGLGVTDTAAVVASGRLWLQVPETVQVCLHGTLAEGVSVHDLALEIVGQVGSDGARGQVLEFCGPSAMTLSVTERMKLSNFAVEMGAVAGLFGVDETCIAWLRARGADTTSAERARPNQEGEAAAYRIDLAAVSPNVARPSRPDHLAPLSSLEPVAVDQVFIGSCAGGRLEDLSAAAAVLRSHGGIHADVRLLVGPASREVAQAAQASGLLDELSNMGAVVLPTGCGACMGRLGALAPGEVAVSTQNRNFVGRVGSPQAEIYLASPETAALCAATGKLAPRETL